MRRDDLKSYQNLNLKSQSRSVEFQIRALSKSSTLECVDDVRRDVIKVKHFNKDSNDSFINDFAISKHLSIKKLQQYTEKEYFGL